MSEDSSRFLHALAADVVAHEACLPRARTHVLGLGPNDGWRQIGIALGAPTPRRSRLRRLLLFRATPAPPTSRLRRVSLRLLVGVDFLIGLRLFLGFVVSLEHDVGGGLLGLFVVGSRLH